MVLKVSLIGILLALSVSFANAQSSRLTGHTTLAGKNSQRALELGDSYDTTPCNRLGDKAERLTSSGAYQEAYDTAKAYLLLCYNDPRSSAMFGPTTGANEGRSTDSTRFIEYREWLKSVLYLRHDNAWYCDDVDALVSSMDYFEGRGFDVNGALAIADYIISTQRCDSALWSKKRAGIIAGRHTVWIDSTLRAGKDTLLYPMDTTIPTLEQLKLGILRGDPAGIAPNTEFTGEKRIENIHVSENPFARSSSVEFELNDYGLVTFELFDALGRLQFTNGIGQVLSPGRHSFDIDGSKLASGVYFARLSYHGGEVKSVMIRKE